MVNQLQVYQKEKFRAAIRQSMAGYMQILYMDE